MIHNYKGAEDILLFNTTVQKMREFFLKKGFVEVNTQDRLSILAACEDPTTVATYQYAGEIWPLPQTGQMWLEYELLTKPHLPGVFCVSTSYRNEQNPIPGRHKIIFPMFEFESRGDIDDLQKLETELLEYMGFGNKNNFIYTTHDDMTQHYKTTEISYQQENSMKQDFGNVVFMSKFPIHTSPFWNMKKSGDYAHKIDVIINGNETIGSAERSCDVDEMRKQFQTISDGGYAGLLYEKFGRERVDRELDEFLSMKFFPRFGGGIGITRMMGAVREAGLDK
jgi:aspartyl/asparaginyl-tRNA synthetase